MASLPDHIPVATTDHRLPATDNFFRRKHDP